MSDAGKSNRVFKLAEPVVLGIAWSLFSALLHARGHVPSAPFSLFGNEQYLIQASYLWALVPLVALLADVLVGRIFRVEGFAKAWSLSTLCFLIVPEFVTFWFGGFGLLQKIFPLFFLASHGASALWILKKNASVSVKHRLLGLVLGFGIIGVVFALFVR